MSPSSLDALPNEILRLIIGYATDLDGPSRVPLEDSILPPCSREIMTSRKTFSRVSRVFYNITAEFLYELVHLSKIESYLALDLLLQRRP